MKKWLWLLLPGVLLMGALIMAGCFSSPTDPNAGVFTSVNNSNGGNGGNGGGGGGGVTPTPTRVPSATPTPTTLNNGSGSISGTISGTTSGLITITVVNFSTFSSYTTTRTGTGAYTISGLPAGTYDITASDTMGDYGTYTVGSGIITVGSGANVTGINITMY